MQDLPLSYTHINYLLSWRGGWQEWEGAGLCALESCDKRQIFTRLSFFKMWNESFDYKYYCINCIIFSFKACEIHQLNSLKLSQSLLSLSLSLSHIERYSLFSLSPALELRIILLVTRECTRLNACCHHSLVSASLMKHYSDITIILHYLQPCASPCRPWRCCDCWQALALPMSLWEL